ncbi:hypothetical protein TWF506_004711 [Arthrobotrys conoides]|uniref:Uncharacterized protein n=1 Tax=Arthrobotrys conoides TaxID=74498 RepID=A0AAN8RP73_9PEZI
MDPQKYIPVAAKEEIMHEKEIDPNNPYITTPTTPRISQTFSTPPDYPTHPPLSTSFSHPPSSSSNIITPYTLSQAKNLVFLTLFHSIFLLWWILSIFLGIYSTPTKEDDDPNEQGITPAFSSQLLKFRISLIGMIPAFLISLFKATALKRVYNNQRLSEESRRLTVDINNNEDEDDENGGGGYYNPFKYGKQHLLIGKWWEEYIEWERLFNLCLHIFAMVITIWLAVGKFRGYIRPRGPFDDAICAFSDPRAFAGEEVVEVVFWFTYQYDWGTK